MSIIAQTAYYQHSGGDGEPTCPTRKFEGDAGFDIYVSRDTWIGPLGFVDIHTDLKIALPDGTWGRVVGRSSSVRRRHLLVVEGIIDNGYRGELFFGVLNLRPWPVKIKKGERLAQLLIHDIADIRWRYEGDLPDSVRGSRGFGSTGK